MEGCCCNDLMFCVLEIVVGLEVVGDVFVVEQIINVNCNVGVCYIKMCQIVFDDCIYYCCVVYFEVIGWIVVIGINKMIVCFQG